MLLPPQLTRPKVEIILSLGSPQHVAYASVPGVFVSHAASDKPFVDAFVDNLLLLGCEVPRRQIFYSSGAATGVPGGADLGAYVRGRVGGDVLVVALITPTFLRRPFCIAELGAAWGQADNLLPLLSPEVSPDELDGILTSLLVRTVDDDGALDELHDRVGNAVGLLPKATTWSDGKRKWLGDLTRHLKGIASLPHCGVVSAAACSRELGHMEMFWADHSANVRYRWWLGDEGWSHVERMGEVKADHLAAVSADGLEILFGIHGTGQVWYREWVIRSGGHCTAGDVQRLPGDVVGPLTGVSRGWAVELAAWTPDGTPCHLWRTTDGWTGWTTEWH